MLQVSRRGSVQDVSELSMWEDRALRRAFGRFGDPEARAAGAEVVHRYQRTGAGSWLLCDCLGRVDWPPALIPVAEAYIRRHYDPPWPEHDPDCDFYRDAAQQRAVTRSFASGRSMHGRTPHTESAMAIFHFHHSIVKRSAGRSVVAAAAWQRGINLDDGLLGRRHAYAMRGPGAWSAILLPAAATRAWSDPGRLWNAVEAREVRQDAQLARSFKLSLPYELNPAQNIDLVRSFAQHTFVDAGMVVDVTVRLMNAKSQPNPFASLLATTRTLVVRDGQCSFGNKVRIWNTRASLLAWRAAWGSEVNASLEAAGSPERVDHRSMAERGLDVEPQIGVGVIAKRRYERGLPSDRVVENEAILRRRGAVNANTKSSGEAPGTDDLPRAQLRLRDADPWFASAIIFVFVHRLSQAETQQLRPSRAGWAAPWCASGPVNGMARTRVAACGAASRPAPLCPGACCLPSRRLPLYFFYLERSANAGITTKTGE